MSSPDFAARLCQRSLKGAAVGIPAWIIGWVGVQLAMGDWLVILAKIVTLLSVLGLAASLFAATLSDDVDALGLPSDEAAALVATGRELVGDVSVQIGEILDEHDVRERLSRPRGDDPDPIAEATDE